MSGARNRKMDTKIDSPEIRLPLRGVIEREPEDTEEEATAVATFAYFGTGRTVIEWLNDYAGGAGSQGSLGIYDSLADVRHAVSDHPELTFQIEDTPPEITED